MRDAARSLLIFGMHVHVGVPDMETGMKLPNVARYFLPHLLALSTSSPFWMGRNTGFKSYRSLIFSNFPRTGIPGFFASHAEFERYLALLVKTGCIDNGKKIWWDIRPHPFFGTIEVRVCDMATRVEEATALAALIQAIFVKLFLLFEKNLTFRIYPVALLNENKWRAVRYGIDGEIIDFGKEKAVPARDLLPELLELLTTCWTCWALDRRSGTWSAFFRRARPPIASLQCTNGPVTSRQWWISSSPKQWRG